VLDHVGDAQDVPLGESLGDGADADAPQVSCPASSFCSSRWRDSLHFLEDGGKQRGLELFGSAGGLLGLEARGELLGIGQKRGGERWLAVGVVGELIRTPALFAAHDE